jgi:hypothetical protein
MLLIEFATHDGLLNLASFELRQEIWSSRIGEELLTKLIKLGVRPNVTLAGARTADGKPTVGQITQNTQPWGQPAMRVSGTPEHGNWLTDPLAVYRPNASPALVRIQGFAIGFFLSIIGVIVVLVLSDQRKQGDRLIGALAGMAVWVGLMWFMGAFDPWLRNTDLMLTSAIGHLTA